MKIKQVKIHNVRSIGDLTLEMNGYQLLVGANNAGKSNVARAIQLFYGEPKWTEEDIPKFAASDGESWVQIWFRLTQAEWNLLPQAYQANSFGDLVVRRYFRSTQGKVAKNKDLYAVVNGKESEGAFFGAKGVGTGKLGKVVYIPAVATAAEKMKTTGASPYREVVKALVESVLVKSPEYQNVMGAIGALRSSATAPGGCLEILSSALNAKIAEWNIQSDFQLIDLNPDDIVKNMVHPGFLDKDLNGAEVKLESCGQGYQRAVVNALITLYAEGSLNQASKPQSAKNNGFSSDFVLFLYEEPEAFLHPSQQVRLFRTLMDLGKTGDRQVLASSHSAVFASQTVESGQSSLVARLAKDNGQTLCYQVDD